MRTSVGDKAPACADHVVAFADDDFDRVPLAVFRRRRRVAEEVLLAEFVRDACRRRIEIAARHDDLRPAAAVVSDGAERADVDALATLSARVRRCFWGRRRGRRRRGRWLLARERRRHRLRARAGRLPGPIRCARVELYEPTPDASMPTAYTSTSDSRMICASGSRPMRLSVSLPSEMITSAFLRRVPACASGMAEATVS